MAKILVVDDSQVSRNDIRAILESDKHEVIEAIDGTDGLMIARNVLDLEIIITDFNMPNMNGIEMSKLIHEFPHYKSIPVFVLTTETNPELKARGKEAGVTVWIIKPPIGQKILETIHIILKS